MKEDWTKQMKQKLDGHQMTPPAGLWEDISQQMGLESKPAPKVTSMRRYYWAAAAVVLAIVGFFEFYQFDNDESQPQLTALNEPVIATQAVDEAQPSVSAEQPTPTTIPVHTATSKPTLLAHTPIPPRQDMSKAETAEAEPQQEEVEVVEVSQEVAETSQESSDETPMVASNYQKQTYLPDVSHPYTTDSKSNDSDKWAIGLSGSNGLLMAANNSIHSDFSSTPEFYGNNTNYANPETQKVSEVVYKHHIPVRFGLSLQYHLNDRISLLSGISYTYLKTDISSQLFNNQSYKQTLNYLGIPVGLSWEVWSSQNFHFYLGGSGLLEKCVDASITDGDISQRPWQWSVNASAGAEYIVMRQFGLYLEPSLGYYFDDGSSLQHYYKEHPLVPSLQFGLRLHLK